MNIHHSSSRLQTTRYKMFTAKILKSWILHNHHPFSSITGRVVDLVYNVHPSSTSYSNEQQTFRQWCFPSVCLILWNALKTKNSTDTLREMLFLIQHNCSRSAFKILSRKAPTRMHCYVTLHCMENHIVASQLIT